MMSGSNEQQSECHSKEDQDLCQVEEVVERPHQREKKSDGKIKMKKTEFGDGCPLKGRALELVSAVQEPNVESLLAHPHGNRGVESGTIRQPSSRHDRGGLD